jgi:protein-tyrosine phosphatase
MNFYVYSRQKAKRASYKIKEPTLIISITDPLLNINTFAPNSNIVSICRVQFDDVNEENARPGEVLMTSQDAAKIKEHLMTYKDKVESIIVHCEVGVSRSAGIMAAIQKYMIGDDSAIFDNDKFSPNMHCYNLMLSALEV